MEASCRTPASLADAATTYQNQRLWTRLAHVDQGGLAATVSTILESFEIHSPQHEKLVAVDFAEGLDDSHLDFIETAWSPLLKRQYDLSMLEFFELPKAEQTAERWLEMLGSLSIQDQHWNWRSKCSLLSESGYRVFSLLTESEVEAAMVLRVGAASRDIAQQLPVVYVDYLAVAPWNRKPLQDPPRFRNLGTLMIGAAVELSRMLGYDGRCGLHSLPQAEGFYQRIGMRDLGVDHGYHDLRYFEFDASGAAHFRR